MTCTRISNTQLAAALVVLGHEILPTTNFSGKEVIFEFEEHPQVAACSAGWRRFASGEVAGVDALDALLVMYNGSRARQWILDQVIHGEHNHGLELPAATMTTNNLDFAICLVAKGHYLLKLDKTERVFYFAAEAEPERGLFNNPPEESDYYYLRNYLKALNHLVRRINSRNITGQQKRHAITCAQP